MSILIKGMELPEIKENEAIGIGILHGRLMELKRDGEGLSIGIMTGRYAEDERWTYYPICVVKTPHGRLVDADALKDYMDFVCGAGGWMEPVTSAVKDYVRKNIDHAPTVVEAEEQHGDKKYG